MPKLFNVQTRKAENLPFANIEEAIKSGSHSYKSNDKINIVDEQGDLFEVQGLELRDALDQGFKLESPVKAAVREFIDESGGRFAANLKVAGSQFVDEALLGVPEVALDLTEDTFDRAVREEIKNELSVANTIGGIGGFGASFLIGAPIFKAATAAGKAVSGAARTAGDVALKQVSKNVSQKLGKKISESQVAKLIGKAGEKATQLGVEGGVIAAPRTITEAALGDPEAAAESLMLGIGVGSVIGSGLQIGSAVGKKAKDLLNIGKEFASKTAGKIFNAEDSALKIIGATAGKANKMRATDADVIKNLPNFLKAIGKEDKAAFFSSKRLLKKLEDIKEKSGKTIGDSLDVMDNKVTQLFDMTDNVGRQEIINNSFNIRKLKQKIDDTFIKPNEGLPGFEKQLKPIRKFIEELDTFMIKRNEGTEAIVSPKKLNEFRKNVDNLIKFEKDPGKRTLNDDMLSFVRRDIQNFITTKLAPKFSKVAPELGGVAEQLVNANKNFRMAATVAPLVGKRVDKEAAQKLVGLPEVIGAAVGTAGGGPLGLLTGAVAGKASRSLNDLSNVVGLLTTEQAVKNVGQKLNKISNIINKKTSFIGSQIEEKGVPAMLRIIGPEHKNEPKAKQLKLFTETMSDFTSNVEAMSQNLADFTDPISQGGAPNIAETLQTKLVDTIQYIDEITPKSRRFENPIIAPREWQPSDTEMGKFQRQLEVVMDPMTVVRDLENGSLTRDQIEALDRIYPKIAQDLRRRVFETLAENPRNLTYNERIKLSLLMGIDLDVNLTPQFIAKYQTTFMPESKEEAVPNDLQVENQLLTETDRISEELPKQ